MTRHLLPSSELTGSGRIFIPLTSPNPTGIRSRLSPREGLLADEHTGRARTFARMPIFVHCRHCKLTPALCAGDIETSTVKIPRNVILVAMIALLVGIPASAQGRNPNEKQQTGWPGETLSGNPCYGKESGYGPFDYTDKSNWPERLHLVESAHFPKETEHLTGKGAKIKSTNIEYALSADMDYTLRAFPNHHRALWSWVRLYQQNRNNYSDYERETRERKGELYAPPECYLQRAIKFAPQDAIPHMILGIYLHKSKRLEPALKEYLLADKMQPKNAELKYNIGLLYFDLQDYEKAKKYADEAKSLGYPLEGLERKLRRVSQGQP